MLPQILWAHMGTSPIMSTRPWFLGVSSWHLVKICFFFQNKIYTFLKKSENNLCNTMSSSQKEIASWQNKIITLDSVALRKKPPQWEGHKKTECTQRQSGSARYSMRSSRAAGELPWMRSVTEWETTSKEQIYHGLQMIYSAKKHGCSIAQTLAGLLSFPHSPVPLSESSAIPPHLSWVSVVHT